MRISTNQIYDTGALGIQRNQSTLYKLQNQLSSGRRVLTPEDDPVAAAQALLVTQTKEVNGQHVENQGNASGQLGLLDSQLSSLTDLLQNVRERVIQAGNTGTLNNSDRQALATELESRLGELLGIANSQNGSGDYLFSGFKGATLPFAIDASLAAVAPASTSPYGYFGDDGERLLQVSASRQMAVNVSGADLFMNVKGGNGTFATATGGNIAGGINQGTAMIDVGSVLDQQKWQVAVNGFAWSTPTNPALQIRFSVAAGVSTYELYDISTPATPVAISAPAPFTPGQAIPFASTSPPAASVTDFGSQVVVKEQPADGDTFVIEPSSSQSLFQTMQSLIGILRTPIASPSYTTTQFGNDLGTQLTNLDQGLNNVSRVQATVGTRMRELDSLGSTSSDLDIQYQQSLSKLQDLDFAKAISEFTLQQTYLEAAQKSFAQISGLSLFQYL
ncbi:flagellar hook-associated protein FlgL [Propionivibrio sp.]|uniref:flagellar hook-associated protein FlgL n=1 Tax=Propionivibrio sp. TaxID=2212460 RepID=UPI0025F25AE4|nr:flagellar hook-associated protein FlgL [Propionivibrio sp.]MBK7355539.1 flagellar hook-associated protein FlgL [Propionivibrio sp.]MBK8400791.1 flagellar hook-associated protein FlgL [Propionivibrio sp.]MBK8744817.1 flagellar hook-associated protein FlgL [Propionivibrio sp.]MBK8893203.1 flagellar hook-associated protein FlgL [Propionivibrio sp.]MBL0207821.1 flagellar hook-associated protein FlgL [Propionivibrio sp.]